MGLDVCLYKKLEDWDKWNAIEKKAEDLSEEVWDIEMEKLGKKEYNDLTEEERDTICNLAHEEYKKLGLNEWGSAEEKKELQIEMPSEKYPKHLFKIGYFRSSYNDGGINHITRNLFGKDLYWIFEPKDEEYFVHPDWKKARERCVEFMEEFNESIKDFPYRCFDITHYMSNEIKSERQAMEFFREQLENNKKHPFGSYSHRSSYFSLDEPMKVSAIITGISSWNKDPATYIIYKADYESYLSSIEIVLETIDYVLAQPDPEKYILHWSA